MLAQSMLCTHSLPFISCHKVCRAMYKIALLCQCQALAWAACEPTGIAAWKLQRSGKVILQSHLQIDVLH